MFISQVENDYEHTYVKRELFISFLELGKTLQEVNRKARVAAIAVQIPVVWVHVTQVLDPQASMEDLMSRHWAQFQVQLLWTHLN